MSTSMPEHSWTEFFDATEDREPREMVLKALTFVPGHGQALDLGCGCGCDTLAMLAHGLHVTAVDAEAEAIKRTRARVQVKELGDRLTTVAGRYEDFGLGTYDLINAGYSLPFCEKEVFEDVWKRLCEALRPGGVFSGQFFGDRDQWAREEGHRAQVFLPRNKVGRLIANLERLHFEEHEEDGETATGKEKHWHLFHMVLRKPSQVAGH